MTTRELFELVESGGLSKLDIYNQIQAITDNYNRDKLNLLCSEFDSYIFHLHEEWRGSITEEKIKEQLGVWSERGRKAPLENNRKHGFLFLYVRDFFLRERWGIPITDEEYDNLPDTIEKHFKIKKYNHLDVDALFGGFYFHYDYGLLLTLRDSLIDLKRKHTTSVYRSPVPLHPSHPDNKRKQLVPITWIKNNQSLRNCIQDLIDKNMIECESIELIINQHFDHFEGQVSPIKWVGSKVLLAHLINGFEESKSIKTKAIWKELSPHFIWNGKTPTGLRQSANNNPYPNNIEIITTIVEQLKQSK